LGTRVAVPLSKRKLDWALIGFFAFNFVFITYLFDMEQLTVANPEHFAYPLWPPAPIVDLGHWWGHRFDPLLLARPPFWRATIWLDVLVFGPFYARRSTRSRRERSGLRSPRSSGPA